MFKKILIANRGEIAVRVAQTAKKMGIESVGVFSEADKNSLHVDACQSAFYIGSARAQDSYLSVDRIIDVALESGADAVHPGYGFLSENAEFAKACEKKDIVFIGPSPSTIRLMGMKNEAKKFLEGSNVPIIPGYHSDNMSNEHLFEEAKKIGFPVLIKAAAGGGGRGLRLVKNKDEFYSVLESARREALSGFGSDHVILEKYLTNARHIEVQIFGDKHGDVIHLFERDCSLQRKHQKVIEEAPALGVSEELRGKIGAAAVSVGKIVEYVGAGTVEFILLDNGEFFFMEMNTRLQVEHPVTEEITNLDLVEWQIRIANGEPLPLKQSDVKKTGHSIEARVYAEIPERQFLPTAGRVSQIKQYKGMTNARLEIGVREGDEVGVNYDAMIAKIVVKEKDADSAIDALREALSSFCLIGIDTNLSFLQNLLAKKKLLGSRPDHVITTGYIDDNIDDLIVFPKETLFGALVISALYQYIGFHNNTEGNRSDNDKSSPWGAKTGWSLTGKREELFSYAFCDKWMEISLIMDSGGGLVANLDEFSMSFSHFVADGDIRLWKDGNQIFSGKIFEDDESVTVLLQGRLCRLQKRVFKNNFSLLSSGGLKSPLPGVIVDILVDGASVVAKGEVLMIVEAMKMEHEIVSPFNGRVSEIYFKVGDKVEEGIDLIALEKS